MRNAGLVGGGDASAWTAVPSGSVSRLTGRSAIEPHAHHLVGDIEPAAPRKPGVWNPHDNNLRPNRSRCKPHRNNPGHAPSGAVTAACTRVEG